MVEGAGEAEVVESTHALPPRTPTTSNKSRSYISSSPSSTPSTVLVATPSPTTAATTTAGNTNANAARRGGVEIAMMDVSERVVMGPPRPPPRRTTSAPISALSSSFLSSIGGGGEGNNSVVSGSSSTTSARSRVGRVLKRLRKPLRRKRSSKATVDALSSMDSFSEAEGSSLSGMESSLTYTSVLYEDDECYDILHEQQQRDMSDKCPASAYTAPGDDCQTTVRSARTTIVTSDTSSSLSGAFSPPQSCIYQDLHRRQHHDLSFPHSLDCWVSTAQALARSREFQQFVQATGHLLLSTAQTTTGIALGVTGAVVKTVSLPVTVPLHVTAAATDHIINLAGFVIGGIVHHTIGNGDKNVSLEESESNDHKKEGPSSLSLQHNDTPAQDLLHNVLNFVPFVVNRVVTTAIHSVQSPALQGQHRQKAQNNNRTQPRQQKGSSQPKLETTRFHAAAATTTSAPLVRPSCHDADSHTDFLDRLRLDFGSMEEEAEEFSHGDVDDTISARTASSSIRASPPNVSASDVSKYLLRVDDVNVMLPPNPASDRELRVMFVDIGGEFEDENLTKEALNQLISRGIDIASSNAAVKVQLKSRGVSPTHEFPIEWKPQGQTKKECKRLSELPESAVFDSLRRQVLIWSGTYNGQKYHGSDQTIFMARGVVKGSPRDFMRLLWDSRRTSEYNNYCLGRKDVRVIHDDILSGGSFGAKIIKSETSIPFTSLSVSLTALMHARAIGNDPEDGYIIFSRSLNVGRAGYHTNKKHVDDLRSNKNEIIVGVNYMRAVPGQPHLTDLISVSQVNASMLPPFLAFRIGMMGVEDFFKNVR